VVMVLIIEVRVRVCLGRGWRQDLAIEDFWGAAGAPPQPRVGMTGRGQRPKGSRRRRVVEASERGQTTVWEEHEEDDRGSRG
jgi:hypothetical protein